MIKRILSAIILLAFAAPIVFAAVTPNSPVTAQTPNIGVVQFLQGTDTAGTYKTLYTGATNGTKLVGVYATTNDASASHLVTCQVKVSSVLYGGTAVTIPISSGFAAATPAVNMLSAANWPGLPIDRNGNPFLFLPSGDLLQCTFATALTSTDVLNLVAVTADF